MPAHLVDKIHHGYRANQHQLVRGYGGTLSRIIKKGRVQINSKTVDWSVDGSGSVDAAFWAKAFVDVEAKVRVAHHKTTHEYLKKYRFSDDRLTAKVPAGRPGGRLERRGTFRGPIPPAGV